MGASTPKDSLTVGDRWLFFLRKEDGKPIVLDYYGNDSRPIFHAQEQIETLRRLRMIGDFGILRGSAMRGPTFSDRKPVPGISVVASRLSDHAQFFAMTDAHGHYEFQALPVGKYELTDGSIRDSYVGDAAIEMRRGSCHDVTLWAKPEPPPTRLGGYVKRTDGSPVAKCPVLILREDGRWFTTQESAADGYFHEDSLPPGRYVVGIGLPGAPAWKAFDCGGACLREVPEGLLYYPGMHNRYDALVITLGKDEKRDDIDFTAPR